MIEKEMKYYTPGIRKNLIKSASLYASEAHKGQFRKGGKNIPYITHPVAVMNIVKKRGGSIEAQIASVLHDVVEDCGGYTVKDISTHFGTAIALLVDYVSETDKSLTWKERKIRYINRLKQAPRDAVIVSAGDKLHNLRCTEKDFEEEGESAFNMFNSSADGQFWFYESLIEIYKENGLNNYSDEMEEILKKVKSEFI
jgi:(p)ppGpp synthase/HD superfamily hydrolase